MAKTHNELTEGYWFFRDGDEITIVQLEKPTATSPLYILWPGNDEAMPVIGKPIDRFIAPVTMPERMQADEATRFEPAVLEDFRGEETIACALPQRVIERVEKNHGLISRNGRTYRYASYGIHKRKRVHIFEEVKPPIDVTPLTE